MDDHESDRPHLAILFNLLGVGATDSLLAK